MTFLLIKHYKITTKKHSFMFIFNEKKRKEKGLYIFDSTTQKLGNLILNLRLKHKQSKKNYMIINKMLTTES